MTWVRLWPWITSVAAALIVLVELEIGSLDGLLRLALAAAGLGCVFVAISSLGLRLAKRWGFYGLAVMHLLALPILWVVGTRYVPVPLAVTLGLMAAPLESLAFFAVGVRRYWKILD